MQYKFFSKPGEWTEALTAEQTIPKKKTSGISFKVQFEKLKSEFSFVI